MPRKKSEFKKDPLKQAPIAYKPQKDGFDLRAAISHFRATCKQARENKDKRWYKAALKVYVALIDYDTELLNW